MNLQKFLITAAVALAAAVATHAGPISKGGFTIRKPGKYFLTRNLVAAIPVGLNAPAGIVIEANDVELDLAGFAISAPNNFGVGIYLADGVKHLRIQNGRVQGVQLGVVSAVGGTVTGCIFERLQIVDCTNDAFTIRGRENVVRSCTITGVAVQRHGIIVVTSLGGFNEVSDCTVASNPGASVGINAGLTDGLIVRRCVVVGFEEGIRVTMKCKLFDNLTMDCLNPIVGNPVLVGSNN